MLQIRLKPHHYTALKAKADAEGVSVAVYIINLVKKHLEN